MELIKQIKNKNKNAKIVKINNFVPQPMTEIYDLAVKNGFKPPEKLEDWIDIHYYNRDTEKNYDVDML